MDDEEETGIRIKVYYHYWLFSCVLLTFFSFCFSFFLSFFLLSILGILSFTVLALEANFFFLLLEDGREDYLISYAGRMMM